MSFAHQTAWESNPAVSNDIEAIFWIVRPGLRRGVVVRQRSDCAREHNKRPL
jgi:hypothetical protein